MPRRMPELAKQFRVYTEEATELARGTERIRVQGATTPLIRQELSLGRIYLIYEMAFLRIFAQWETFLEASFLRYMCGYSSIAGYRPQLLQPACKELTIAKRILFGPRPYLLWHDPNKIAQRSRDFFSQGRHETVVLSNAVRLQWLASIRHRIAHDQEDAKSKFDIACMNLCGRRFRGGRPGMFLREWTSVNNQKIRWLEAAGEELVNLADQVTA
jgi:hypothetical protein